MDWTNDMIMRFLNLYEAEPVIWSSSHPNHKNRNHIHDAWKRIECEFGDKKFSVMELKRKKDSLMTSFRSCLNKIKASKKSGTGTDEIYKPHWFAFEKMASFLGDKDVPKPTLNTEYQGSEENSKHSQKFQQSVSNLRRCLEAETEKNLQNMQPEDLLNVNGAVNESIETEDIQVENEAMVTPSTSTSTSRPLKPPPNKNKRNCMPSEQLTHKMNKAYSILESSLENKRDVCCIFGELVAAKLRAFDENMIEVAMNRIQNILFELRMSTAHITPHSGQEAPNSLPSSPLNAALNLSVASNNSPSTIYSQGSTTIGEECEDITQYLLICNKDN